MRRRTSPDGRPQAWTAAYGRGWDRAFGQHFETATATYREPELGQELANWWAEATKMTADLLAEVRHKASSDPVGVWETRGTLENQKDDDDRS